ncbi:hypothetical protein [Spirosoma koreense]
MNRFLIPLTLCWWLLVDLPSAIAQTRGTDALYKLDRSVVQAKINEVTATDVFYTEPTSPTTTRKIRKADLWKIVFSDGSTDVFNSPATGQTSGAASQKPAVVRSESNRAYSNVSSTNESGDGPQSIIKYAPLTSFGYEKVLPNNRSIYAGLSLYSVNSFYTRVTAIGFKGEYRFYGLVKSSPKRAPEGFWVAPTALFWNVTVRDLDFFGDTDSESAFVVQLGAIAGYQWVFNRKISLEPAFGLSLTAVGSGTESALGAGIVPLLALRVGYVLK